MESSEPPAALPGLAERLRVETRSAHTASERSRFMSKLLRSQMDRAGYCALLRNLQPIYAALEHALAQHASHPVVAAVFQPALVRTQSLVDDLTALHGPAWADEIALQPAAADYVRRVQAIGTKRPELLLSHAYVRYLGDLSGGQVLRRIVADSLSIPAGAGTAFYDFGDASEASALAKEFRQGLAGVTGNGSAADELVAEAMLSFALHQRLFDELADAFGLVDERGGRAAALDASGS